MSMTYVINRFVWRGHADAYHIAEDEHSTWCGLRYDNSDHLTSPFHWETRHVCVSCERYRSKSIRRVR
jgi:hypothetical protein